LTLKEKEITALQKRTLTVAPCSHEKLGGNMSDNDTACKNHT